MGLKPIAIFYSIRSVIPNLFQHPTSQIDFMLNTQQVRSRNKFGMTYLVVIILLRLTL